MSYFHQQNKMNRWLSIFAYMCVLIFFGTCVIKVIPASFDPSSPSTMHYMLSALMSKKHVDCLAILISGDGTMKLLRYQHWWDHVVDQTQSCFRDLIFWILDFNWQVQLWKWTWCRFHCNCLMSVRDDLIHFIQHQLIVSTHIQLSWASSVDVVIYRSRALRRRWLSGSRSNSGSCVHG